MQNSRAESASSIGRPSRAALLAGCCLALLSPALSAVAAQDTLAAKSAHGARSQPPRARSDRKIPIGKEHESPKAQIARLTVPALHEPTRAVVHNSSDTIAHRVEAPRLTRTVARVDTTRACCMWGALVFPFTAAIALDHSGNGKAARSTLRFIPPQMPTPLPIDPTSRTIPGFPSIPLDSAASPPSGPSSPSSPGTPSGPTNPGKPGSPNDPAPPGAPNPSNPSKPGTPNDPGTPGAPGNPGNPAPPGNQPDDPGNPSNPGAPGNPPSGPSSPNDPGTPSDPGSPWKPGDDAPTPPGLPPTDPSSLTPPADQMPVTATPEPATLLLIGTGFSALGVGARFRRRRSKEKP